MRPVSNEPSPIQRGGFDPIIKAFEWAGHLLRKMINPTEAAANINKLMQRQSNSQVPGNAQKQITSTEEEPKKSEAIVSSPEVHKSLNSPRMEELLKLQKSYTGKLEEREEDSKAYNKSGGYDSAKAGQLEEITRKLKRVEAEIAELAELEKPIT